MELIEYKEMEKIENNHAWFVAKRNFVKTVLEKYNLLGKNLRVLDIGCGTGAIMEFFKKAGFKAFGVDMSEVALDYCRQKGLEVALGTAEQTNQADESFDLAVSFDVLEHVAEDQKAVDEIWRILKPGGWFIASVPAHQFLWSYHDVALHHYRRYNKQLLSRLFADKFIIRGLSWIHAGIFIPIWLSRLVKRKVLGKEIGDSDVREAPGWINAILNIWYAVEIGLFRIFGRLPFGISLLIVVQKKQ